MPLVVSKRTLYSAGAAGSRDFWLHPSDKSHFRDSAWFGSKPASYIRQVPTLRQSGFVNIRPSGRIYPQLPVSENAVSQSRTKLLASIPKR